MTGEEITRTYLLDSSILIEAHRRYYGFDICSGFWDCLLHYGTNERLLSIDKVKEELQGEDKLTQWANGAPECFFVSTDNGEITAYYGVIIEWVRNQKQFRISAIDEFARVADGWLIAYARVNNFIIVTHEVYAANVRNRVPIPNVCKAFNVPIIDTFDMLRELDTHFHWRRPQF